MGWDNVRVFLAVGRAGQFAAASKAVLRLIFRSSETALSDPENATPPRRRGPG